LAKNVVTDICVVNERERVPKDFTPVDYTYDTSLEERALRRKVLCVKKQLQSRALDAVCDLIILTKQKVSPQGYHMAGYNYVAMPNQRQVHTMLIFSFSLFHSSVVKFLAKNFQIVSPATL
uniref:MABP domain-containing protein n=1 Tax=Soboliphyme baturini TaxID=241478 RepID=A0A183IHR5_9BILA